MAESGNKLYEQLKTKPFAIINEEFLDGKGNALFFNVKKLRDKFDYIGLWYACDKNEDTSITTEFYYASGDTIVKPSKFDEEVKENSFKVVNRFEIPKEHDWVWVAARNDNDIYCRMKIFTSEEEHTYINYKVIRNRETTFDTLASGLIKGSSARFFKLGLEDGYSKVDFNDTIMYVVLIEEMPPDDWNLYDDHIGIQRLPIRTATVKFSVLNTYSTWLGQNPMNDVK